MKSLYALVIAVVCTLFVVQRNKYNNKTSRAIGEEKGEAAEALAQWYHSRAFPFESINMENYSRSFLKMKENHSLRTMNFPGIWNCIGPMNFGGRTLSLAFNPQNPNTIYAGSAGGGLWKSYTGGIGATAWQYVTVGYPVLGIGAISINPNDSNEIYIGTGEVYNYQNTGTGYAVRTTRGTYGIGILKSTDGGATWSKSLDWQYDELRGIQDIVINPLNPNTVFAATSEGTYRSLNAGATWALVNPVLMATDIAMHASDTSMIFVAAGNSFSANPGIYRSVNGGTSFTKLTAGLPSSWSGKALLCISPSQPGTIYASIANQLAQIGFYKSTDHGLNWTLVNTEDIALHQGWYSHDVAVRPDNPDEIICAGLDTWKSTDGGITLEQKSYWYNWDFSATPIGGPEGTPDYVHADIHHVYYHPSNFDIVYYVCDGGVFRSDDGGETFSGANGMYHTTQFYANFSNSSDDSLFAIGGMQDNATAVYEGNPEMRRVIGGDGLSTAINPNNDNIVYGSYTYLSMYKSTDKAQTFNNLNIPPSTITNFAGPYVLSLSNTQVLYAGSDLVFKSVDAGDNWSTVNSGNPLDGNPFLCMAISNTNSNLVYAATAPTVTPQMSLFKTTNGGTNWTDVTGTLPNRYLLDIAIDPVDNNKVFVTLGGYGTAHLFRSINAGSTWAAFGTGLPDVPTNTITIDPLNNQIIYLGNDLGVFASIDGGAGWQSFSEGIEDAVMVFDISISPSNRKLRIATHGKGIYERPMLPVTITSVQQTLTNDFSISVLGNPFKDVIVLNITSAKKTQLTGIVYTNNGKKNLEFSISVNKGSQEESINVSKMDAGIYYLYLFDGKNGITRKLMKK